MAKKNNKKSKNVIKNNSVNSVATEDELAAVKEELAAAKEELAAVKEDLVAAQAENASKKAKKKAKKKVKDPNKAPSKASKLFGATNRGLGRFFGFVGRRNEIIQLFIIAVITTMIVEFFAMGSLIQPFIWMVCHPVYFLINVAIVAVPFTIGLLTKRRYRVYCWVSLIWIIFSIIDFCVILNRVTPLTAGDLRVLSDVFPVLEHYIPFWSFFIIIPAIIVALIILAIFIHKVHLVQVPFKRLRCAIEAVVIAVVCYGFVILSMNFGWISTNFANIRNAYFDYGFAYCFSNSIFNTGIKKPDDYSKQKMEHIKDDLEEGQITTIPNPNQPDLKGEHPNIIFVQLESFFNVNRLNGVEFTENPIPIISNLYENYNTGYLHVPSISAGTANTEFEVLTGMNYNDFGPGEYPFKTILCEKTAESIAYNLKNLGYSTHGIHNNTAGFYSRNIVYANLGIDVFSSIEYMVGAEKNQLEWAKDKIITKYVNQALDSTEGQDFVFAVSVQGHGAYPSDNILEKPSYLVSLDGLKGSVNKNGFAYYLEALSEMDEFVGELIDSLSKRDEKSVVVFYGDHLPGFTFEEEDLNGGTLYDTEYVIWSNFDLGERQVVDLEANELAAYVQDLLDYHEGLITKVHQNKENYTEEEYWENIHDIAYDMLYGELYLFDGETPYIANPIKYAYDQVEVDEVSLIIASNKTDCYMTVKGKNFTEYSTVYLHGDEKLETIYVDEHTIFCPRVELKPGDTFVVGQARGSVDKLTHTEAFTLTEDLFGKK